MEKNNISVSFEEDNNDKFTVNKNEQKITEQDKLAGFVIPREHIKLPSLGKLYPKTSALHLADTIEVRQMTTTEEDILSSRSLIKSGKAMNMVIQNCIVDKTVNVDDLFSGDRAAIMVGLRVGAYGADYNVSVACPTCGEENKKHIFDLSKLEINTLDIDPVEMGVNLFKFKMPSGVTVSFKFLTTKDTNEISEINERMKKVSGSTVDRNVSTRIKFQIVDINDSGDSKQLNDYLKNMSARDSREFRKYYDELEPDVIMKQEYQCPFCGTKNDVTVPFTSEFFWPES